MEPAVKVIHGSTRRVWVWKLSARMLALVASICAIGLVGSFLAALNADHIDYGGGDYVDAIFVITLAIVSLCWNAADVICIFTLAGHRGLHPTTTQAVDLLLWVLLFLVSLFPQVMCGAEWCTPNLTYRPDFRPVGAPYAPPEPAFIFGCFLCVFHIGLFILACCQAATWNKNVVRVVVDPEDDESVALAGQLYECYLNGGPLQEHASLGGYQTEWVKNYPAEPVEKESVSKKT